MDLTCFSTLSQLLNFKLNNLKYVLQMLLNMPFQVFWGVQLITKLYIKMHKDPLFSLECRHNCSKLALTRNSKTIMIWQMEVIASRTNHYKKGWTISSHFKNSVKMALLTNDKMIKVMLVSLALPIYNRTRTLKTKSMKKEVLLP